MGDFTVVSGIGTFYKGKQIANCDVTVEEAFYLPGHDMPSIVKVSIRVGSLIEKTVVIPVEKFDFDTLFEKCALISCEKGKNRNLFNSYLISQLQGNVEATMNHGNRDLRGCYLDSNGLHRTAGGRFCVVEGSEVVGVEDSNFLVAPEVARLEILHDVDRPMAKLLSLLNELPGVVMMVVAYAMLTMLRSAVITAGADFQAVLNVVGMQGVGKTTLAMRAAGYVTRVDDSRHQAALLFGAGSTWPTLRDAMSNNRDLPIIVDDLCYSASKVSERKRIELAAQIVREASNAAPIMKKSGRNTEILQCVAGVILTAEFTLENASDLTRCIIAKVKKPLDLPDEFNRELTGSAAIAFVRYFVKHSDVMLPRLQDMLAGASGLEALEECGEARVRTNHTILRWAFHEMLRVAIDEGCDVNLHPVLIERFDDALREAIDDLNAALRGLRANVPEGNLAYVLLTGYNNGVFQLAKQSKLRKLVVRDGVIWEGDLCLRAEPLETFVRQQNGFRN